MRREFADLKEKFAGLQCEVSELTSEVRAEFADLRSEIRVGFASVDPKLEKQFRTLLISLMSTIVGVAAVLSAMLPNI